MPAILTITLNPAVDISTETAQLLPSHKVRCGPSQRFPGGGSINVARVIHRLGGDCVALYLAGGVVGQQLRHLIALEHLPSLGLAIGGETREIHRNPGESAAKSAFFRRALGLSSKFIPSRILSCSAAAIEDHV